MSDVKAILAQNVRVLRKQLELSQMQLAERCGVSTKFIQQLEAARQFPAPRNLEGLAEVFGIEPYQLLLEPNTEAASLGENHAARSMLDTLERDLVRDVKDRIASIREKL